MQIYSLPDIAGSNTTVEISATAIQARWVAFSANGSAHVGDSTASAAKGVVVNGTVQSAPVIVFSANEADPTDRIDLSQIYAYVPTASTLHISYGA